MDIFEIDRRNLEQHNKLKKLMVDSYQDAFREEFSALTALEGLNLSAAQAKAFYEKYKSIDLDGVPKLSDLCIHVITTNDDVVDRLFEIYGPETNFPIPNRLVERILQKSCLDYDQYFKLALLLINNNSTFFYTEQILEDRTDCVFGEWEALLWQKLASLASEKLVKYTDNSVYPIYVEDAFSLIATVLPHLAKFSNLKVLDMSETFFHDYHLVQLAQSVPNLRSLTFKFNAEITNIGINALAKIEKLEEVLYFIRGGCYFVDAFTKECLGAMPKLKIVGSCKKSALETVEHAIPEFDQPTELALEQLCVINELKKSCRNSSLPNVRSLWIKDLSWTNQAAQDILNLGLHKLESLSLSCCPAQSVMSILSRIGHQLTNLDVYHSVGAINYMEMINMCPNLKKLDICVSYNSFLYQFIGSSNIILKTPQHLESLSLNLGSTVELPSGVIASLMQAPKLKTCFLRYLDIPEKDCLILIDKLQAGGCNMLTKFHLECATRLPSHDKMPFLICAIALFCPDIKTITYQGDENILNPILVICSTLLKHCDFIFDTYGFN